MHAFQRLNKDTDRASPGSVDRKGCLSDGVTLKSPAPCSPLNTCLAFALS